MLPLTSNREALLGLFSTARQVILATFIFFWQILPEEPHCPHEAPIEPITLGMETAVWQLPNSQVLNYGINLSTLSFGGCDASGNMTVAP